MKKRILYIWKSPYPWDVRAEKICKSLGKNNFDVALLAKWAAGQPYSDDFGLFSVYRAGVGKPLWKLKPFSLNPVWRKAIKNVVNTHKPDIIISRDIMLAEAACEIAHKHRIPCIIDMAENYAAVMKGWRKYKKNIFVKTIVHTLKLPDRTERRSVALADGMITVCEEMSDRFNRLYGFPYERMQVVSNTPELEWFADCRKGASKPPKIIAYQGAINSERNLTVFLKGFILAAKKNKSIEFEASGVGEEVAMLRTIAAQSDCSQRIRINDRYAHSELPALIGRTDIGVLPFKINEHINNTVANKLFDYMAAGKPSIVSPAVPMERIINETGAGIVHDCSTPEKCAEAIDCILASDLTSMSEKGISAALSKYNWENDTQTLIKFLSKFI